MMTSPAHDHVAPEPAGPGADAPFPVPALARLAALSKNNANVVALLGDLAAAADLDSLDNALAAGLAVARCPGYGHPTGPELEHMQRGFARARLKALLPLLDDADVRPRAAQLLAAWITAASQLDKLDLTELLRTSLDNGETARSRFLLASGCDLNATTVLTSEHQQDASMTVFGAMLIKGKWDALAVLAESPLTEVPLGQRVSHGDDAGKELNLVQMVLGMGTWPADALGAIDALANIIFPRLPAPVLAQELRALGQCVAERMADLDGHYQAILARTAPALSPGLPGADVPVVDVNHTKTIARAVVLGAILPDRVPGYASTCKTLLLNARVVTPSGFSLTVYPLVEHLVRMDNDLSVRCLRRLLEDGLLDADHEADPERAPGQTLLHVACARGREGAAKLLLEHGADPGRTLLQEGSTKNCIDLYRGFTPDGVLLPLLEAALARQTIGRVIAGASHRTGWTAP